MTRIRIAPGRVGVRVARGVASRVGTGAPSDQGVSQRTPSWGPGRAHGHALVGTWTRSRCSRLSGRAGVRARGHARRCDRRPTGPRAFARPTRVDRPFQHATPRAADPRSKRVRTAGERPPRCSPTVRSHALPSPPAAAGRSPHRPRPPEGAAPMRCMPSCKARPGPAGVARAVDNDLLRLHVSRCAGGHAGGDAHRQRPSRLGGDCRCTPALRSWSESRAAREPRRPPRRRAATACTAGDTRPNDAMMRPPPRP